MWVREKVRTSREFLGNYCFVTFSLAARIAPFRSILAGQTKEQVPHCWQYSTPSFFTRAQFPLSAASLIDTVGILPEQTSRHLPHLIHSVTLTSENFLAFGSLAQTVLSVLALGTPTRSSNGHVTFIMTNAKMDPPKKPMYT